MASPSAPPPKHLIIAGFHRSGTSMTAQLLHKAGLPLGGRLYPPDPFNTDGHFEDVAIVEWHEAVLRDNGANWRLDRQDAPAVTAVRLGQLRKLVADRDRRFPQWGFKDPRACLFLDVWAQELRDPFIVIVYRHVAECYRSIIHRASHYIALNPTPVHPDLSFWLDPCLILRMWLAHNQALVRFALAHPGRTLVVSQAGLLAGFPLVAAVNERFGFGLDAAAESGIKPDLSAMGGIDLPWADTPLRQALEETWQALNTLSAAPAPAGDASTPARPGDTGKATFDDIKSIIARISPPPRDGEGQAAQQPAQSQAQGMPEDAASCSLLGERLCAQGRLDEAEAAHREALARKPFEAVFHIRHGINLLHQNRLDEAVSAIMTGIAIGPVFPAYYMYLGSAFNCQGNLPAALLFAQKAIDGDPGNPYFHLFQSDILLAGDSPAAALEAIDKALSIDARSTAAHIRRIETLQKLEREEEALMSARLAIRQIPGDADLLVRVSRLATQAGHSAEGKDYYKQYMALQLARPGYLRDFEESLERLQQPQKDDLLCRVNKHLLQFAAEQANGGARPSNG